jgi:hypothetical protein
MTNANLPRRAFLTKAAIGGASLVLATTGVATATAAVSDSVPGLIEVHQKATVSLNEIIGAMCRAEARGEWSEERDGHLVSSAHHVEYAARRELVEAVPTSLAGVTALMGYARQVTTVDAVTWDEDDLRVLVASAAEALQRLNEARA